MPWWWKAWQSVAALLLGIVIGVPVVILGLIAVISILIKLGLMEPWVKNVTTSWLARLSEMKGAESLEGEPNEPRIRTAADHP
jgi:hypothetical protein